MQIILLFLMCITTSYASHRSCLDLQAFFNIAEEPEKAVITTPSASSKHIREQDDLLISEFERPEFEISDSSTQSSAASSPLFFSLSRSTSSSEFSELIDDEEFFDDAASSQELPNVIQLTHESKQCIDRICATFFSPPTGFGVNNHDYRNDITSRLTLIFLCNSELASPELLSLERDLYGLRHLRLFRDDSVKFCIIMHALQHEKMLQRTDMLYHLKKIFSYLEEKRLENCTSGKRFLTINAENARSIIQSMSLLFEIPQINGINPAQRFIDLNYTNKDIRISVFFLAIIHTFCTLQHERRINCHRMRHKLVTITEMLKHMFHFKGKFQNHIVTERYVNMLLLALDVPEDIYIQIHLLGLFPSLESAACSTSSQISAILEPDEPSSTLMAAGQMIFPGLSRPFFNITIPEMIVQIFGISDDD
ncbi:MAG: hypothetical protein V4482_05835 [Pseudomonadota bacterium]